MEERNGQYNEIREQLNEVIRLQNDNEASEKKIGDNNTAYNTLMKIVIIIASVCLLSTSFKVNFDSYVNTNRVKTPSKLSKFTENSLRPNIIFILADDLGWNSMGYEDYDLDFVTPYLTDFATNGLKLTSYYAQEVCTPSRAAFLTGRYPLSIGMQYGVVQTDTPWGLNLNETTIAEVLSDSGYATHMLGKWHLGHHSPRFLPTARGFDSFTGYVDGDNYYYSKRNPTKDTFFDFMSSDQNCYYSYDNPDMHNYSTHFYRDNAIEIIEQHDTSVPLFLYLAFQAVHDPFQDVTDLREVAPEFIPDDVYDEIMDTVVVSLTRHCLLFHLKCCVRAQRDNNTRWRYQFSTPCPIKS
jgi:hypothetical protein